MFPGDRMPRTHANLLMKMRVVDGVLPEFVKYWVMSPLAVKYIRRHTKGTSPSVQKINQRALINMPFPKDVSINQQREWVSWLDTIFQGVETIERDIRDQFVDLQRLPHSILSAAFKGEL